jgi:hypothetical protein
VLSGCAQGVDSEPLWDASPPSTVGEPTEDDDRAGEDGGDGDPQGDTTGGWTSIGDDGMGGTGNIPPGTSGPGSGGPGSGGSTGFGSTGFGESDFGESGFGTFGSSGGECFPCGDGTCVPAEWLCDGFPDCDNGSDENPLLCF